jgi:putative transposase
MRYTQEEKMEIIRLVDGSDIGVNRTLKQLGIHKSTFYNWYHAYQQQGYDGLADCTSSNESGLFGFNLN